MRYKRLGSLKDDGAFASSNSGSRPKCHLLREAFPAASFHYCRAWSVSPKAPITTGPDASVCSFVFQNRSPVKAGPGVLVLCCDLNEPLGGAQHTRFERLVGVLG